MESYEIFIERCTDPYWIVLATFISGIALGGLIVLLAGAAEDLRNYLALKRVERAVREAAKEVDPG